jgi:hypothetical protein
VALTRPVVAKQAVPAVIPGSGQRECVNTRAETFARRLAWEHAAMKARGDNRFQQFLEKVVVSEARTS